MPHTHSSAPLAAPHDSPLQAAPPPHVAVLGAGSWGTALAKVAARRCPTVLWARQAAQVAKMVASHENARFLPGITLPDHLKITDDLDDALACVTSTTTPPLIILGVPLAGLQTVCTMLAPRLVALACPRYHLVWTCKGVDAQTGQLPHEIARHALATVGTIRLGVLSGPSFAREVAQGLPVGLTIASQDAPLCAALTHALHGQSVRIYTSSDVVGVEIGGAMKNIIAIACGISDGLMLGMNARAALITRGLVEMTRLGMALGAHPETFAGLTGLGDLVLTATGDLSRNRRVGLEVGAGRQIKDILAGGMTAEGVHAARAILARAQALGVELPITASICAVLFEGVAPMTAVSHLLAREARLESID